MSNDFPYNADDFEDDENKKIARMMRWMYFQLNHQISDNQEVISGHEDDISKLKKKIHERNTLSEYKADTRAVILKVSVGVAAITGSIMAFLSLFI